MIDRIKHLSVTFKIIHFKGVINYQFIILDLRKQHRQQVVSGKLSERRVLCNQENHKIILVRLEVDKLENETPIAYAPGDHVAVYPHHTDSEVNFVMEHLTKKPSDLQKELVLREYNQNEGKNQGG